MTNLTTYDLAPFYRQSIGLDRLMSHMMNRIDSSGAASNYPPYNIIKTGDETYLIELAVAGFEQGDINMTVHDGMLTITGDKKVDDSREYLHKGIGHRKFLRTFNLADYIEVQSAAVNNGVLTVELERIVPDSMKPKTIQIEYKSAA